MLSRASGRDGRKLRVGHDGRKTPGHPYHKLLSNCGRLIGVIGVENKVWSGEQPKQLSDYQDALCEHFPGVPLDGAAPEAALMSVNTMLEYVPGASDELRDDLTSALAHVSEGHLV